MHHMQLKAAVKKFSGIPEIELREAIASDEAKYSPEDIDEIIKAINNPAPDDEKAAPAKAKTIKYEGEIKNEEFLNLVKKMHGLKEREKYAFGEFRVEVLREERYEGIKDTPIDIVGIRFKDTKPMKVTKTDWKTIKSLNGINSFTTKKDELCITDAQFASSGRPGEGRIYLPMN